MSVYTSSMLLNNCCSKPTVDGLLEMFTFVKLFKIVYLYRYGRVNMHKASPRYLILHKEPLHQLTSPTFQLIVISNDHFLGQKASSI
jgi:hypothetical protein